MPSASFERTLDVTSSPEEGWKVLTDVAHVAGWVTVVREVHEVEHLESYRAVLTDRFGPFELNADVEAAWQAADACGNTNSCSQTMTVVDTIPPVIVCPPNIVAAEEPRDSGYAAITIPPLTVSDICDSSPSVACSCWP